MLRLQGLNSSQHGRWAYEWALPQNGSRFCRLVHPGSGGKTGISMMLSKETGGGSALPGGDGTSRAECLTLIYFPPHSPLQSVSPALWKFSFSPYLHLISSLAPALLPSPARFSGERLRPSSLFVLPLRSHPSFQEWATLFYFSPSSSPHVQLLPFPREFTFWLVWNMLGALASV